MSSDVVYSIEKSEAFHHVRISRQIVEGIRIRRFPPRPNSLGGRGWGYQLRPPNLRVAQATRVHDTSRQVWKKFTCILYSNLLYKSMLLRVWDLLSNMHTPPMCMTYTHVYDIHLPFIWNTRPISMAYFFCDPRLPLQTPQLLSRTLKST